MYIIKLVQFSIISQPNLNYQSKKHVNTLYTLSSKLSPIYCACAIKKFDLL